MKQQYQLQDIGAASQAFVDESALIDVPHTTIKGRAQIPDIANDLKASLTEDDKAAILQKYPQEA